MKWGPGNRPQVNRKGKEKGKNVKSGGLPFRCRQCLQWSWVCHGLGGKRLGCQSCTVENPRTERNIGPSTLHSQPAGRWKSIHSGRGMHSVFLRVSGDGPQTFSGCLKLLHFSSFLTSVFLASRKSISSCRSVWHPYRQSNQHTAPQMILPFLFTTTRASIKAVTLQVWLSQKGRSSGKWLWLSSQSCLALLLILVQKGCR